MKVQAPFIGFPSPNEAIGVWHLFARVGARLQHAAFMTMGPNRWGEPQGSFTAQGTHWDLFSQGYRQEDLERWSEFRP